MDHNYRAHDARRARRARIALAAAALVLLAAVATAIAACDSASGPASSVSDAYRLAHPTGAIPGALATVDMGREQVAKRITGIVGAGVRIVLPASLPPGFRPAAPYVAVGDGTARPNPEGWGRSYRISYTDGRGLLVMTVGAESRPKGVDWNGGWLRVDGRPARAGRAGSAIVVATTGRGRLIVITARSVEATAVLATAASVSGVR